MHYANDMNLNSLVFFVNLRVSSWMLKRRGRILMEVPVLETERLILRRLELRDAPQVQKYAGSPEVEDTTLNIPHPYPNGAAEEFIQRTWENAAKGESYTFAITRKGVDELMGVIGMHLETKHDKAEIGYWLGKPHWGQGIMTEAVKAILRFGFKQVGLNRIYAAHFTRNPASGRVMQKAGMRYEGILRQGLRKGEGYEDEALYAILASDERE
jgi:[ribosomal protein S5]-alanine N-acetyltransferase